MSTAPLLRLLSLRQGISTTTRSTLLTRPAPLYSLRLRAAAAAAAPTTGPVQAPRPFSSHTPLRARKDAQGKDDLKPEPNEYSKSGSDDAAAGGEAAFDPSTTTPEGAAADSKGQKGGVDSDPLDVSPANPEVSKPRGSEEGGHQGSSAQSGKGPSDRERTSGGGSPNKGSEGKKYSS